MLLIIVNVILFSARISVNDYDLVSGLLSSVLTHYRPAMSFENRKNKYIRGSFQFSIVTMQKISPPWKPEILLFRHFPKLKIEYFNEKNPFNFS